MKNAKQYLIFISAFFVAFLFFWFIFSYQKEKKTNLLNLSEQKQRDFVTINGQKVMTSAHNVEQSALETFTQLKSEIANNPKQKLINEGQSDNRYYISYSEDKTIVSILITPHTATSCDFTIHRGMSLSQDNKIPLPDFPILNDATPLLNLKGSGSQLIFSYSTRFPEKEILDFYRKKMADSGYREEKLELPKDLIDESIKSIELLFIKERKNVSISIMIDPMGNGYLIYVVIS